MAHIKISFFGWHRQYLLPWQVMLVAECCCYSSYVVTWLDCERHVDAVYHEGETYCTSAGAGSLPGKG